MGLILAIETSCDETAASVVESGTNVLSSVVSSQIDIHARYGGVVPEVASRAHVEMLTPVIAQAMVEAGIEPHELTAVAATVGPGLIGSLLIGVSAAKSLALVWDKPFVPVNHLEGHLYAASLEEPDMPMPIVTLLVSGGHTMLVLQEGHGQYRLLGETLDDAAGEAFDKVARYLGLGYPGGPIIDRMASRPRSSTTSARIPTQPTSTWPRRSRKRSWTCSSPRPAAPCTSSAPRRCASVAASPRTRACVNGSSTCVSRTGCAPSCRAAPCAPTTPR